MIKFLRASNIKTTECGSCYGASNGCCNSCKEVLDAFQKIEKSHPPTAMIQQCRNTFSDADSLINDSCTLGITLTVPHTHGSFFITIGQNTTNTSADYLGVPKENLNFTHSFDFFSMGGGYHPAQILQNYMKVQKEYGRYKAMYYIRATRILNDYDTQYSLSVTSYDRYRDESSDKLPGVFINYDISPLILQYVLDRPIYQIIIDMMAIIGGIFAFGLLIDNIYLASTLQSSQIV
ncbi:hypothetical protein TVAG_396530 [Trichomonas vaginalis G3]|uniref:Endoplasmic reticulum vesicle transporter C-terminal domain-containing protein n=1 Tax=Trichomonas vaginalis (strain ATCC PRA-98 / G3) TaxID=412133 RepID=A2FYD2_TRIV3|nr:vesicle-mediated transport [Trichomonas vaginalis G3]EAX90096.1 hypothetical protein TVAG_396530 [Trichomonas vaginalis G3]KAI5551055.1 vesicle-mediated transport [Trichomonas vaginalis G3]|eukprot:XP_001303026.1 hypothetical protein [Trichomonas vaginalis G3]